MARTNAQDLLDRFGEGQGWTEASKLALLCQYVDNQGSPDALEDFLQQQADDENLVIEEDEDGEEEVTEEGG